MLHDLYLLTAWSLTAINIYFGESYMHIQDAKFSIGLKKDGSLQKIPFNWAPNKIVFYDGILENEGILKDSNKHLYKEITLILEVEGEVEKCLTKQSENRQQWNFSSVKYYKYSEHRSTIQGKLGKS